MFSTFLECSQMSGVFYHSVIHGFNRLLNNYCNNYCKSNISRWKLKPFAMLFLMVFLFQIRLDDSKSPIAPGYNFRYGISIHIYQDIILLMIEVVIRKKYWSSIQVILSWDGNVYIILLLLILFFRFAKYYVKDNVLYRTLLKAYGIRFAILVYGEVIPN